VTNAVDDLRQARLLLDADAQAYVEAAARSSIGQ
jgi:hypothetical protein